MDDTETPDGEEQASPITISTATAQDAGRSYEQLLADHAALMTENARLRAERDLLSREVDHRIKNSLSIVSSLLTLQAMASSEAPVHTQLMRAAERVAVIAGIHGRLYEEPVSDRLDAAEFLGHLCADLARTISEDERITVDARIEAAGPIPAERASIIGLIVAELVMNASRHAFPHGEGRVEVAFADRAAGGHELIVADNGVGLPQDFDPKMAAGLGMDIIQIYAGHHGWLFEANPRQPKGSEFRLIMPN